MLPTVVLPKPATVVTVMPGLAAMPMPMRPLPLTLCPALRWLLLLLHVSINPALLLVVAAALLPIAATAPILAVALQPLLLMV